MEEKDLTLSRNILEFVTIAGEYCRLIENLEMTDRQEQLISLRRMIPLLYFRGSLLPQIQASDPDSTERYVTEEQWESVFLRLRDFFSEKDIFWYPETWEEQVENLKGSISENLTDAYQDLKDFVLLYKKPHLSARENAIFEVKALFESNWGMKIAILLPLLHRVLLPNADENLITDDF